MPARLYRRGALGVGRLVGGEPSSEIDRRVLGSIGSGVAKGLWRHVTTAMWQGVGKDLGVPPREVALVVAAPGAVVLEVKGNVGATKARPRRRTPVRWRWSGDGRCNGGGSRTGRRFAWWRLGKVAGWGRSRGRSM